MLCLQLTSIMNADFSAYLRPNQLRHGANMPEVRARPDLPLGGVKNWERDAIHKGKDRSIQHMLAGGNGFPEHCYETIMARTAHDVGVTTERRDLRSLLAWQADLQLCLRQRNTEARHG